MKEIFICDIDGTLMPSNIMDNEAYWQAVHDVFDMQSQTLSLTGFENVTDNGLLHEWSLNTLGRALRPEEVSAIRERFLVLLKIAADEQPECFTPLPGLRDWLVSRRDKPTAIATGGWEHSARFKIETAGLDEFALPLASSDQGENRAAIMQHALALLGNEAEPTDTVVTYVGDGVWDLAAARTLGWEFIGIAQGERASELRSAGAGVIHADFHGLL